MQTKDKEQRRVVILLIAITTLLVLIIFSSIFYLRASRPMRQARSEAIDIAEEYTDLAEVDQFYWFTRESTSFSLVGKDNNEKEIVVIIPKSGDKVTVYNQEDGLTEAQAKHTIQEAHPDQTIQKATLGLYEDTPAWEIMTKDSEGGLSYFLIAFKDGEEINTITNM